MNFVVFFVLLLNALTSGMRRGPHHPLEEGSNKNKHHHYMPRGSGSLISETQVLHDTKHIEEDAETLNAEALARMTPEELEFRYFSSHDFDKNSKLDGLEILKAVYHTVDRENHDPSVKSRSIDLEVYIELVDRTLELDDTDGDGYISYAEYRAARDKNPSDPPKVLGAHYRS